jgi:putative oxidoreductase
VVPGVLLGAWSRVGISLILVFLVLVTPVMHRFWTDTNPQHRSANIHSFISNVVFFALALSMLFISPLWSYSLDAAQQKLRQKAAGHAGSGE